MRWGSFQLYSLHENLFWIDGGAMYGVVPRIIWEKLSPPDERHRVTLRANLMLIRGQDGNILVETGLGDDIPERWKEIYGLREPSHLLEELGRIGLGPEEIDTVNSHPFAFRSLRRRRPPRWRDLPGRLPPGPACRPEEGVGCGPESGCTFSGLLSKGDAGPSGGRRSPVAGGRR